MSCRLRALRSLSSICICTAWPISKVLVFSDASAHWALTECRQYCDKPLPRSNKLALTPRQRAPPRMAAGLRHVHSPRSQKLDSYVPSQRHMASGSGPRQQLHSGPLPCKATRTTAHVNTKCQQRPPASICASWPLLLTLLLATIPTIVLQHRGEIGAEWR